ncbi:Aste57867_2944 [Aphanomyces stellatus]|uniref:Aste57867_2944 protein n=1 Tax=Aphanomyces stellatus TaxID=120398 RepID=A0A485KAB9_9STRA|nr:hypothetical protein As57867_002936 [Aphanomyces stellatus]VFT80127.1 Aste57867_2944 [Aphanomyces stellatus]
MAHLLHCLCLAIVSAIALAADLPLCGAPITSYIQAKKDYPYLGPALDTISNLPTGVWWTDNNPTYRSDVQTLLSSCNSSSIPIIVVYGLPHKDCGAGYSDKGFNKDTESYLAFIQDLVTLVGNRPVLYVMEPDAIGIAATDSCGKTNQYVENMQQAVPLLTANVNARLYFDVGFWIINNDWSAKSVADVIASVGSKSRKGAVKGIVLNTSNIRKTSEMIDKCKTFLTAAKQDAYRCVIDTSRNYRTPNTTSEWCNNKYAAIGVPPTSNTGMPDVLDYFLWVKVPGESDGECNATSQSKDAMAGPRAGYFFEKAFSMQWDRGYFVDKGLGKKLGKYDVGDDMPVEASGVSAVTIVVIIVLCILAVVVGVLVKRRYDAKRHATAAAAGPQHCELNTPAITSPTKKEIV